VLIVGIIVALSPGGQCRKRRDPERKRVRQSRARSNCGSFPPASAASAATLRALSKRFADGRLSDEALSRMTDDEIEAALTEVSASGLGQRTGS
jgi:hypothetical protein